MPSQGLLFDANAISTGVPFAGSLGKCPSPAGLSVRQSPRPSYRWDSGENRRLVLKGNLLFSASRPFKPRFGGDPLDRKHGETGPNSAELEVGTERDRKTVSSLRLLYRPMHMQVLNQKRSQSVVVYTSAKRGYNRSSSIEPILEFRSVILVFDPSKIKRSNSSIVKSSREWM